MAEKPSSNIRCAVCGAKSQSVSDPWRRTARLNIPSVTTERAIKSRLRADTVKRANIKAGGLKGGIGGRKVWLQRPGMKSEKGAKVAA